MSESKTEKPKSAARLNHVVFWPPFLLLVSAVALNFFSPDTRDEGNNVVKGAFSTTMDTAKDWILNHFSWLFTLCALLSLLLCIWICFSGFGKVRIGGKKAEPLMSMWNWFSITICTTIAIGMAFPRPAGGTESDAPRARGYHVRTVDDVSSLVVYTVRDLLCCLADVCVRLLQHEETVFSGFYGQSLAGSMGDRCGRQCD